MPIFSPEFNQQWPYRFPSSVGLMPWPFMDDKYWYGLLPTRAMTAGELDPSSDTKKVWIASSVSQLGPGVNVTGQGAWAPAIYIGQASDPTYNIVKSGIGYSGQVKMPAGAKPPTDPGAPDNHCSIVDITRNRIFSMWKTTTPWPNGSNLNCTNCGMADATGNVSTNLSGYCVGRGSGISQPAGCLQPEDVWYYKKTRDDPAGDGRGKAKHALCITMTQNHLDAGSWGLPACKTDGQSSGSTNTVKEGQRFRLKYNIDERSFGAGMPTGNKDLMQTIIVMARDFGCIFVDGSGGAGLHAIDDISWISLGLPFRYEQLFGPKNSVGSYNSVFRDNDHPFKYSANIEVLKSNSTSDQYTPPAPPVPSTGYTSPTDPPPTTTPPPVAATSILVTQL